MTGKCKPKNTISHTRNGNKFQAIFHYIDTKIIVILILMKNCAHIENTNFNISLNESSLSNLGTDGKASNKISNKIRSLLA